MSKYELWICVVGDGEDERIIYQGDDMMEVCQAVMDHQEEVLLDIDKYFLLNDVQFYTYDEINSVLMCVESR